MKKLKSLSNQIILTNTLAAGINYTVPDGKTLVIEAIHATEIGGAEVKLLDTNNSVYARFTNVYSTMYGYTPALALTGLSLLVAAGHHVKSAAAIIAAQSNTQTQVTIVGYLL